MTKNIKITIAILLVLLNYNIALAQSSSKIIFLTDIYKTFVNEVKANEHKTDSIYKVKIQRLILEHYFKKS